MKLLVRSFVHKTKYSCKQNLPALELEKREGNMTISPTLETHTEQPNSLGGFIQDSLFFQGISIGKRGSKVVASEEVFQELGSLILGPEFLGEILTIQNILTENVVPLL